MTSIEYEHKTGLIKAYHVYNGKPRRFHMLAENLSVWHVPPDSENSINFQHDMIDFDGNMPVGTKSSYKSVDRIRAVAIQTGEIWDIPTKEPAKGQETLLFARFKGLGDVLMTWFALEEYRRLYPDKHITYLTSPQCAALFCSQQDLVDKVIYTKFDHAATPEVPALPISTRPYNEICNAINQVDFGDVAYMQARADNFASLLDINIESSYDEANNKYIPHIPVRELKISPVEAAKARQKIEWRLNDKVIVMQLNSNGKPRQWFYWNKLAKKCLKDGYKVIYMSTDQAHRNMRTPRGVINLSCRTNIREYISILALADKLICCDTSAMHIGARLPGLQVIALCGSTGGWAHTKYYQNVSVIQGQTSCSPCWDWQLDSCSGHKDFLTCMKRITADMVMDKIRGINA